MNLWPKINFSEHVCYQRESISCLKRGSAGAINHLSGALLKVFTAQQEGTSEISGQLGPVFECLIPVTPWIQLYTLHDSNHLAQDLQCK